MSFRKAFSYFDDIDQATGEPNETASIFPEPDIGQRIPLFDQKDLPPKTYRIYIETIKCFNRGLHILAAIGLRAIIESVCLEQKVKGGNLQKGIDRLATEGHLLKAHADFLHNHRFMGNLAAHEIEPPPMEDFIAALDIAETLLKTMYVLPRLAAKIKPKKP
jgi:hypothetical protein